MWGPDIHVSFNKWSEAGAMAEHRQIDRYIKELGGLATGGDGAIVGSKCQRKKEEKKP